jgi:hypothetical protein
MRDCTITRASSEKTASSIFLLISQKKNKLSSRTGGEEAENVHHPNLSFRRIICVCVCVCEIFMLCLKMFFSLIASIVRQRISFLLLPRLCLFLCNSSHRAERKKKHRKAPPELIIFRDFSSFITSKRQTATGEGREEEDSPEMRKKVDWNSPFVVISFHLFFAAPT